MSGALPPCLARERRRLVALDDVLVQLALRELDDGLPQRALFLGELEIHR